MSAPMPQPCSRRNAHTNHGYCPGTAPEFPSETVEIVTGSWVSDDLRNRPGFGVPDEFGRTAPFAVYVRYERGEVVSRNLSLAAAEETADKRAAEGYHVSVSLDVCG